MIRTFSQELKKLGSRPTPLLSQSRSTFHPALVPNQEMKTDGSGRSASRWELENLPFCHSYAGGKNKMIPHFNSNITSMF